ncbi:MAG TPA: hypothetical protein DHW63_09150 [Hyphomonadaceae bacterium]|nr:hypothetical protein [Hyphomonadaceae bacterium]
MDAGGASVLLRRFVFGPGVDEALVWYEGTGTGDRRYLVADERGSIVAVTNGAGAASGSGFGIHSYDEYGAPGPSNNSRFQYTGQAWLPEAQLYHYKARAYSPSLGRFLQTDPIGFAGGMNLYGYVGNDPVNAIDPSGLLERGFTFRPAAINHSPSAGRGPGFGGGVKEEKPIVVTGQPCRACQNSRDHPIIMMGFAAGGAAGTSEGAGRGDGDGEGDGEGEGEELNECTKQILAPYISPSALDAARVNLGRIPGIMLPGMPAGDAAAMTFGNNIYFRSGVMNDLPLLAHELYHVQQGMSQGLNPLTYGAASVVAVARGQHYYQGNTFESSAIQVQRQVRDDIGIAPPASCPTATGP